MVHLVGHFVELVDAADALIGQDEGSAFEHHLTGQVVLHDGSSQADAGRTSASCQPVN